MQSEKSHECHKKNHFLSIWKAKKDFVAFYKKGRVNKGLKFWSFYNMSPKKRVVCAYGWVQNRVSPDIAAKREVILSCLAIVLHQHAARRLSMEEKPHMEHFTLID